MSTILRNRLLTLLLGLALLVIAAASGSGTISSAAEPTATLALPPSASATTLIATPALTPTTAIITPSPTATATATPELAGQPTPADDQAPYADTGPREAVLGAAEELTATISSLIAALERIPPEEQARLAEQSELASQLAPAELQALPGEAAPQLVVIMNRLFVPMIAYSRGPDPTPTATATSRPTATATPTRTPRPTSDPDDEDPADISLRIWPRPSIRVGRNNLLAYELRLTNYGDGPADSTLIRLPYNKRQISISHSDLGSRDWVSRITDSYVEVTFGKLSGERSRSGTLYFRVRGDLADNNVIEARASASWDDADNGGTLVSNRAPVLVGGGNDHSDWTWMEVNPDQGGAGTTHRFFSDRFIPGEAVVFWLNTPDGVRALDLRKDADQYGRIWVELNTRGYKPGYYSLVAHGMRSELEAVRSFSVR